jgi:hypothetical protein
VTVIFYSHEECDARFAGAMKAVHKLIDRLAVLKSDRDEWKEQHEKLLAMYRAQSDELQALKASARDGEVKP